MNKKHIIYHINELVTMQGPNRLRKGSEMSDVDIIHNGFLYIDHGLIQAIGKGDSYQAYIQDGVEMFDATGYIVVPGFIDSHTHLVHGGSREHEYAMKLAGVSYLDILKQGGGILSSVKATQSATKDQLYNKAKKSLDTMLLHGTTTVEAKSGYGLELDTEIKQLEVAHMLDQNHPIDVIHTFMGAHAIPSTFQGKTQEYIKEVFQMLDIIKEKQLAKYCDVFCEEGVFSIEDTKKILTYAKDLGFGIKMHADEIVPLGGATLAASLSCVSADHLMASTIDDMKLLAKHNVVANLLPATSFYLDKDFAKARIMIEQGCGIAISTDYNPGSTPCENIQLAMQIASLKMKLSPKEVLTAVTINAACSIEEEHRIGSLEVGKEADFLIIDCPNLDYMIYHYGINHVKDVYKKGQLVVFNKQIVNEVAK